MTKDQIDKAVEETLRAKNATVTGTHTSEVWTKEQVQKAVIALAQAEAEHIVGTLIYFMKMNGYNPDNGWVMLLPMFLKHEIYAKVSPPLVLPGYIHFHPLIDGVLFIKPSAIPLYTLDTTKEHEA